MSARFKLKPIVLTMMPILFAGSANFALAQDKEDEANKNKEDAELEVIQVKGYRGSVMRSINAKRLSDGVQDSIFAEDIGKSTDQNIADALSRITGVTVQESDGEGTRISVRGANSSLNQISLNGVALTSSLNGGGGGSGQSDQSVDLSSFSSDILSSINVIKTAAADHDEGSLGANVILRTVKPLNVNEDIRSLEIQGRYNDYAEKNDSKIAGSFSQKFLDETVGIITTVSKETSHSRTDSLGGSWLAPYQVVDIPAGGATSQQTGLPTTESQKALMADGRSYSTGLNYRERTTGTVGIQWLAGDDTDVQLDLSYSKASYESDTHRISVSKPNLDTKGNLIDDPQSDWWTVDEESHTLTKTLNRFGSGSLFRGVGGNETENKVLTLKINHAITDDLSMELTAGYSKTDYVTTPNASIGTANWKSTNSNNNLLDVPASELQPVGWDCTTGECILVTGDSNLSFVPQGNANGNDNIGTTGFSPYDIHGHHLGYIAQYNETSDDTNKSLFLDFDYAVDFAGITKIEFGGKVSNRRKVVYTDYQSFSSAEDIVFDERGNTINGVGASDINLVDVLAGQGIPVNDFMGGLVPKDSEYNTDYFNGWGILDPDKAIAEMFAIPNIEAQHNNNGDRDLEQDNVSAYLKFNFEYFDSRLTGNVGLRYVKTENSSFGYSSVNYSNTHGISVPYDLIYKKQLWNENATACAPHTNVGTNDALLYEPWEAPIACYDPNLRYDWGNGAGGGGANPDNWTNDGSFATTYDANGVPIESPWFIHQ
ncbi:TonB-dependent receptor plug domain-containing protein [Paraglaciecola aquimarina]|uniref:TonB-dependent receptor plug domain-containing protein n=1 Tax=Paraglaciecola aquimarina TaxID=1235557 RepID=A0ABU3SYQ0_9ALTE|nr:TonB-dependent receptor plug domain-containing protein [Paraglaciecola aquimarina]MDU0355116.1 TonB-dependent receptor plug domain-containing protein [Paraglaciecola aquimarina]